jgi:hypothetical protein
MLAEQQHTTLGGFMRPSNLPALVSSSTRLHAVRGIGVLVAMACFAALFMPWAAHAAVRPVINDVPVFDAPIDGRGGMMNPYVSCTRYGVEPRARMVVTSHRTDKVRTFLWKGALPGMHHPRFAPGTYTVRTVAWCRGNRKVRSETVRIHEKTNRGTISRMEFNKVRRGMTRERVARIVGNNGRDPFSYSGRTTWTYDNMAYWAWSIITYRNGRVIEKYWDTDHD